MLVHITEQDLGRKMGFDIMISKLKAQQRNNKKGILPQPAQRPAFHKALSIQFLQTCLYERPSNFSHRDSIVFEQLSSLISSLCLQVPVGFTNSQFIPKEAACSYTKGQTSTSYQIKEYRNNKEDDTPACIYQKNANTTASATSHESTLRPEVIANTQGKTGKVIIQVKQKQSLQDTEQDMRENSHFADYTEDIFNYILNLEVSARVKFSYLLLYLIQKFYTRKRGFQNLN